jgi:hypothetical protein
MVKHPKLLWIVVLLIGWAFDFFFWGKPVGINFAFFVAICVLGGFFLLLLNGLKPAPKSLLLLIPLVFFTAITIVRQEPLTLFLAYTFTLVSMGLLAITYLGGRWPQYNILDYSYKFFQLVASILISPISIGKELRTERDEIQKTIKDFPVKPVLRGCLIATPIVAVFASLLALADIVFYQKILDFFDIFNLDKIPENIFRLMIILFWACVLAGTYMYSASKSRDLKLIGEDRPVIKPFLGFIEAAIVIGSVVVLFLLFVIVQFRYFFGGEMNIGISGYTYSEYARSGFNELIMVAFASLLMILGLSTFTQRVDKLQRRIFSGLCIAIVSLVIIILISAYIRLSLAINWHGFSRLRLYPRVFLIWVGILFVAIIVLEFIHRQRYFTVAALLASFGFAATLSLMNVDASIVTYNVYRTTEGKHFNVNHLTSLSTDAVPALVDEFRDSSLPTTIHEGIGAALVCFLQSRAIEKASNQDWPSFNLSRWNAVIKLDEIKPLLLDYTFNNRTWPVQVRTPGKDLYVCAEEQIRRGTINR